MKRDDSFQHADAVETIPGEPLYKWDLNATPPRYVRYGKVRSDLRQERVKMRLRSIAELAFVAPRKPVVKFYARKQGDIFRRTPCF